MAGDIGWKSVELQIEALIPGVLILAEANALAMSWFDYRVTALAFLPASEFVRAALFIAGGYSVGVVSSYLTRMLIDRISENGPRKIVFDHFAHHDLEKAIDECKANDLRFDNDLQREKAERKADIASWNAVYRSGLRRTTRGEEVDRRRSQGRLIRNLLLPGVGAPLVLLVSPWSLILAAVIIPLLVFLYAYAEYVNFAEAYDISEARPK